MKNYSSLTTKVHFLLPRIIRAYHNYEELVSNTSYMLLFARQVTVNRFKYYNYKTAFWPCCKEKHFIQKNKVIKPCLILKPLPSTFT